MSLLATNEERYPMPTQRKITRRKSSAKDREFDELLRRAALCAKAQSSRGVRVEARRKRVQAA
jgi:hypothetical protein